MELNIILGALGKLKNFLDDVHYVSPALAPRHSESHAGEDVAIFARGPWAHLFTGVQEQNVIAHSMSYASCVGKAEVNACSDRNGGDILTTSLTVITLLHLYL